MSRDDRKRQVATMRQRYGDNHYSTIAKMSGSKKTKEDMRLMARKRWHPEDFDSDGNLINKEEK
jgi:hypothetical protein